MEGTDEFATWFASLDEPTRERVSTAILLLGASKGGDDRWYEQHVPRADDSYDEHLETIRREGLIDGNDSDQGKDEEVE